MTRTFTINLAAGLASLCLAVGAAHADDALPREVTQALRAGNIPDKHVAIWVQEAGARRPSLRHEAGQPMNPASVMKLVTTYAGLELLGPAYQWRTEAYTVAPVVDGVLMGDIYLKGSGDPRLTFEQFWLLLRQLRAQGLREIKGDLVLDRSAFSVPPADGNFDDQPLRPYNVRPDALLLNWKSMRMQLEPVNGALRVQAEPLPANLFLVSRVNLIDGDCGNWKEGLRTDVTEHGDATQQSQRFSLVITGNYPRSCGRQKLNIGPLSHPQYVYGVFRQLWQELGGSLQGGLREAAVPPTAMKQASIESPSLAEVIRDINKFSNNVMARQLFLTLGNGTPAGADAAIRAWLAGKQLDFPELVLENGSGLSRRERISAQSLGALLNAAWKSPLMPELVASLPLSGVDGTLQKRLTDSSATGVAHLKTGTLEDVKSVAGYVMDRQGRWQIVVMVINHPGAGTGQAAGSAVAAQDALLNWLAAR